VLEVEEKGHGPVVAFEEVRNPVPIDEIPLVG
jgi:hypothetical protein